MPGMARISAPLWGSGHEVEAEINSDGLCLALEWSRDNTHVNVNEIQFLNGQTDRGQVNMLSTTTTNFLTAKKQL